MYGKTFDLQFGFFSVLLPKLRDFMIIIASSIGPSITDGVHRNENLVEIIPVFSTFSNFFKKKKNYKSHFM